GDPPEGLERRSGRRRQRREGELEAARRRGPAARGAEVKRRAWKIVLGVVAVIVLVVGGIVIDAHLRAERILTQARAETQAARAEFLVRDRTRKVVPKDPLDSNAWDDYGPAVRTLGSISGELAALIPEVAVEPTEDEVDDHAIHNLIQEYRGSLDQLRRGARRRTLHARDLTLDGKETFPFTELMTTSHFLAGVVTHEHRMSRDIEAFRTTVTGFQLADDVGSSGPLMCWVLQVFVEQCLLQALKPALANASADAGALSEFASELERLEPLRPDLLDKFKDEGTMVTGALTDGSWDGLFPRWVGLNPDAGHVWPSWRQLFSERISRAQAVVRYR